MGQLRIRDNQLKPQTSANEYIAPNDEAITKMVQAVCKKQVAMSAETLSDVEITEFCDFLKFLMGSYTKLLNKQATAIQS